MKAFFEYGIDPYTVAKMSGIGCSSKTPAYFLGKSHGFNGVHGRMPAIATGAMLANKQLLTVGVSGDGVDQDDIVSAMGSVGFEAPLNIRSDNIIFRGARLPYVVFPRQPNR